MSWLLPLAIACALDDSSFGGGGTEGTPTGGGQAGGDDGGGSGGGGDDTATENCTTADLVWSTEVDNDAGSTPFYSGDSITFWGYVQNPCAVALSIPLESTCLFDLVTLRPPNGATAQEAIVPGCSTTTRTLELGAYDIAPQAYGWGPIYVAGAYGYSMQATTPDERVLSGTFTIQMKAAIGLAVLLVLGAVLWAVLRPAEKTEEDRVRDVIEQVAQGARDHDLDETFEPVSQRYAHDELTRPQVKAYVFSQFQRHRSISVVLGPIDVRIAGAGHATADFEAAIAEGIDLTTLDLLPEQADAYDFHVELEQEDGDWKVVGHEQQSRTGSRDRIVPP